MGIKNKFYYKSKVDTIKDVVHDYRLRKEPEPEEPKDSAVSVSEDNILKKLKKTHFRYNFISCEEAFLKIAAACLISLLIAVLYSRFFETHQYIKIALIALPSIFSIYVITAALRNFKGKDVIVKIIDREMGLKERLVTSLEFLQFNKKSKLYNTLIQDATASLNDKNIKSILNRKISNTIKCLMIAVTILGIAALLLPEKDFIVNIYNLKIAALLDQTAITPTPESEPEELKKEETPEKIENKQPVAAKIEENEKSESENVSDNNMNEEKKIKEDINDILKRLLTMLSNPSDQDNLNQDGGNDSSSSNDLLAQNNPNQSSQGKDSSSNKSGSSSDVNKSQSNSKQDQDLNNDLQNQQNNQQNNGESGSNQSAGSSGNNTNLGSGGDSSDNTKGGMDSNNDGNSSNQMSNNADKNENDERQKGLSDNDKSGLPGDDSQRDSAKSTGSKSNGDKLSKAQNNNSGEDQKQLTDSKPGSKKESKEVSDESGSKLSQGNEQQGQQTGKQTPNDQNETADKLQKEIVGLLSDVEEQIKNYDSRKKSQQSEGQQNKGVSSGKLQQKAEGSEEGKLSDDNADKSAADDRKTGVDNAENSSNQPGTDAGKSNADNLYSSDGKFDFKDREEFEMLVEGEQNNVGSQTREAESFSAKHVSGEWVNPDAAIDETTQLNPQQAEDDAIKNTQIPSEYEKIIKDMYINNE